MLKRLYKKAYTTGTGPPPTDDLTVPTRDELFKYQMAQDKPAALMAESLLVAKICETHQYSRSVFHSAQKTQIITQEGLPDTTRIDSSLVSKIAIISVPKTRELVNMLFFWEEEVTRLRLLDEEEREIEALMRDQGVTEELQMALMVVRGMRQVVPSMRTKDGAVKETDALPCYV